MCDEELDFKTELPFRHSAASYSIAATVTAEPLGRGRTRDAVGGPSGYHLGSAVLFIFLGDAKIPGPLGLFSTAAQTQCTHAGAFQIFLGGALFSP